MGGGKSRPLPEIVLPLFGPGNSGKTTFFNQIKIRRLGGFSDEHRTDVLQMIRDRILFWTHTLNQQIKLDSADNDIIMGAPLNLFTHEDDDEAKEMVAKILPILAKVWAPNSEACKLFAESDHPEKIESDDRIISRAQDLCKAGYSCSDEDIIFFRVRTTGEPEPVTYTHDKVVRITFVDLGGQRIERSNWKNVKDPWGVVFIVGIDCYDRIEDESGLDSLGEKCKKSQGKVSALHDGVEVFGKIAKQCIEAKIPMILLLNKIDLFEKKVARGDLGSYFPDFKQGTDINAAKEFMKNLFLKKVPSKYRESDKFQVHFIKLIDGNAAEKILQSVQGIIIKRNMAASFQE